MMQRVRRNRFPERDMGEIESLMKSISDMQVSLAELTANLTTYKESLYAAMKAAKVSQHKVAGILAEIYCPPGKAQNIVDPKKFHELTSDKDFYSAISVSVTKAKEVLPGKELATIMTKIPAKPGKETVKVAFDGPQ